MITHAFFDFDGTLSLLRSQWPAVMRRLMLRDNVLDSEIDALIRSTTGQSDIVQMQAYQQIRCQHGMSYDDVATYRAQYAAMLREHVNQQLERLRTGALSLQSVVVAGAHALLWRLKLKGIVLVLLSSSPHDDVLRESELLHFRHFFSDVYGASRYVTSFSKLDIIKQYITEHGASGRNTAHVGDGPVEIAAGKAVGGIALGIIGEHGRRETLEAAGADMMVSDFSNVDAILDLFGVDTTCVCQKGGL